MTRMYICEQSKIILSSQNQGVNMCSTCQNLGGGGASRSLLWRPWSHCTTIHLIAKIINLHNLEKSFISFSIKCSFSSNLVLKIILNIAICNSMSTAGKNYKSVLNPDGHYNNTCRQKRFDWNLIFNSLENTFRALRELIDFRLLGLSSISAGNEAWDDYRISKVQSRSQL